MATNRPDTLDPAMMRPRHLDCIVVFGRPDLDGGTHIFQTHGRCLGICFELLSRLCPDSTGNMNHLDGDLLSF